MENSNIKNDYKDTLYLGCVLILAFAAAFSTLSVWGCVNTFAVAVPISLLCVLIPQKVWIKCVSFAAITYGLNSFYSASSGYSLIVAAYCLFVIIGCMCAVYLFKKKSAVFRLSSAFIIVVCIGLNVLIFGNPVSALKSNEKLNDYISETYNSSDLEISGIKYSVYNGRFYVTVNTTGNKAQSCDITDCGDSISDPYALLLEKTLMYSKRIEIVEALRSCFPDDSFEVVSKSIGGFLGEKSGISDTTDYSHRMNFEIYITPYLTNADFIATAEKYMSALNENSIIINKVEFLGGRAGSYYRKITARTGNCFQKFAPEYVSPRKTVEFFNKIFFMKLK